MFETVIIGVGALLTLIMLGLVFIGPSASKSQSKQLERIRERHSDSAQTKVEAQMKRVMNARRRSTGGENPSRIDELASRLDRTGMGWTLQKYFLFSGGLVVASLVGLYFAGAPLYLTLGLSITIGAGLPHLVVSFLIGRRLNKFNSSFPDAIELLVRGLRSGLPVTETISVVGKEFAGPVGIEFSRVIDRIKIGQTMEDALAETTKTINTPEFKFFCITLAIQRETGGNLAETLSNLADVLRKRAQMKLKIKAMSSESKASAYIVGSLPFIVFGLIWSINPGYVGGFFVDDRLIIAGLGGLTWMGIGVLIMAKMVSFEI
jgi:tight adherence protein B